MSPKVAVATIKLTPLDFKGNKQTIINVIDEAYRQDVNLLCFPELCISGYGCEDAFFYDSVIKESYKTLLEISLSTSKNLAIIVGLPIKFNDNLYNCMAVCHDKKVLALIPKQHLANDGIHYEQRWFTAWHGRGVDFFNNIPIGQQVLELFGIKFSVEICQDAWVKENRPAYRLAQQNVEIIFNPSASHFAFGKQNTRINLTKEGSLITKGYQIFVNQLGNEAGRAIYDGDIIAFNNGTLIFINQSFRFSDFEVFTFNLKDQKNSSELKQPVDKVYCDFTKAVALGLFDYLCKSKQRGFVLSLSGGADSTAVALLVKAMIHFCVKEIGIDDTIKRLNLNLKTKEELFSELLVCVYQGTKQNSQATKKSAQIVCEILGFNLLDFELDDIVGIYQQKIEKVTGHTLSWANDDLTLQNIQSRCRAPGVWMLANIRNSLLLTTANRSEGSVGYATMDGDTCGSLAPIAGVSKDFINNWLKWMQCNSIEGFGPFPELSVVTDLAPSAELRPLEQNQTDEKDLMPYEVMDFFERKVLANRDNFKNSLNRAEKFFENKYDQEALKNWLIKFYQNWQVSQWKRERLAPSFHLDTFSVDPKTWFRFPILSAGLPQENLP